MEILIIVLIILWFLCIPLGPTKLFGWVLAATLILGALIMILLFPPLIIILLVGWAILKD